MHILRLTTLSFAVTTGFFIATLLTGCTTTGDSVSLDRPDNHRWSGDLAVMFDQLPERHQNLFFRMPESEYRQRLVSLDKEAAQLTESQFEVALRRILADVGDAHTNISFPRSALFPVQFHSFEEGIFVVAAIPEYETYIGSRLLRVGDVDIAQFGALAAEITPHDNESQLRMMAPAYLSMPTILEGLGVIESPGAVDYTFAGPAGSDEYVSVSSVTPDSVARLVTLGELLQEQGVDFGVSRRNSGKIYGYDTLSGEDAVYVQYNACREDEAYPMEQFVDDVFGEIRRGEIDTLIVDLRRNSGGDSRVFHPFIAAAVESDTPRNIYVLIGRNTFSSAVLNAIDLRQDAGALFVGEPSGGRPNHYGEIKTLELPDLGRRLTYSTKYFEHFDGGDPPALLPDIHAPTSFSAYTEGRDPALDAALRAATAATGAGSR